MRNVFQEFEQKGFDLAEAFRAFRQAMSDLSNERPGEEELMPRESLYASDECEDFPMRPTVNFMALNPEDPAFWTGYVLNGLPEEVAVHSRPEQGKLLPIENGLFKSKVY